MEFFVRRGAGALALFCAGGMLFVTGAHADVYRCPDAGGRVVIQQLPCTGGQKLDVKPAMGGDNPDNARAADRRAAREGNNQEILTAIGKGKPAIGMSEANLSMAMGSPTRVNSGNYGGRQSDQRIYERSDGTWYVYVRDGVVSSTQFSSYPNRQAARSNCPNSLAIRNMETSANSVTISEDQRRVLQRQVADAKACR